MYISRDIKKKFGKISKAYKIVALVGARQAGKTTFLKEQIKDNKSGYLMFDDPDIRELFEEDIKKFEIQNIEGENIVVLDEVQYCKNSGQNLKYLADKGHKLWITASSEMILSKEILSYLVGRVSILKLYPFSLNEFLESKKFKEGTRKEKKRLVEEHILYGGYPKVVLSKDKELKKTILKDLFDTMVLKDISKTFSIEDINSLEKVVKYLSLNIGSQISYDSVSSDLGISFQTIKKYLDAMEKSHLIYVARPFFKNKMNEIKKQPKIYFIDTGLRNLISKDFDSEISGEIFENYVLTEMIKLGFQPSFWRTKLKAEVDFVIEKGKAIIPIEVKLKSGKIDQSLKKFIRTYKPKKAFVVCLDLEKKRIEKFEGCEVEFIDVFGLKKL